MEEPVKMESPRRLLIRNFLTLDECKELEFIHKSSSTVGYRPNVFSTTLSHLIATNCAYLIMPFVPIREKVKEKVEEFFGCEYELCIEFTGLISWAKGASIGWHSDDNRPYLRQREFTAVCYLNTYGKHFKGGHFHFQDGEPATYVPSAGDLLIYTADSRNVHSVDEITDGERLTECLATGKTTESNGNGRNLKEIRNHSHDEDVKLVSRLSEMYSCKVSNVPGVCLPLPASNNMYLFSQDQTGHCESAINICCARIHVVGYSIYSSEDAMDFSDPSDVLLNTLLLARGTELYDLEFANVLHALQIVQYYNWKASGLDGQKGEVKTGKVIQLSQLQKDRVNLLKSTFLPDHQFVETTFKCMGSVESSISDFDWTKFSVAIIEWKAYTVKLHEDMLTSLPHWREHNSMYNVASDEC